MTYLKSIFELESMNSTRKGERQWCYCERFEQGQGTLAKEPLFQRPESHHRRSKIGRGPQMDCEFCAGERSHVYVSTNFDWHHLCEECQELYETRLTEDGCDPGQGDE